MKYDDASWHYGGDFPSHLPNEAGATHIGMFVAWCLLNGLAGEIHLNDFPEEYEKLKKRKVTPAKWFVSACDEKFTDEDLSKEGNAFTHYYYEDEKTEKYVEDYDNILCDELETIYDASDSWDSYDKLAPAIKQRYESWKSKFG